MAPQNNKPTHAQILRVEVIEQGILIKDIGLYNSEGQYLRSAKLNGDILCTLTETLLPITICK